MDQSTYLHILLTENGFEPRAQRNAWLLEEVGRPIKYLDELDATEKHRLIDKLKAMKEANRPVRVED